MARRQGLHPEHRFERIGAATAAMTALHATEPTTPHLSLLARVRGLSIGEVEAALYEERSIVKTMAMRRTLFVVTRDLLPAVVGSAGQRVADLERRRLAREAAGLERQLGHEWIAAACREVVACLDGQELSARQLREALPHLAGTFTAAPGTKWSAEVPTMSRLLTILTAAGEVVRGRNGGPWRISRPLWTSMASWLGASLVPTSTDRGYVDVVGRWLWTFGPGTEADMVWWLGSTKTAVRAALSRLGAVPVEMDDGSCGWVLPDDTADLEAPPRAEPWVALLPTLDSTTMGWRQRGFYVEPAHTPYLFDSAGNAGTTVWVDGRVVGCWGQEADGRVRLVLLAEVPRDARRQLDVEAARVTEFLGGERVTNVYATQQMKRQRIG